MSESKLSSQALLNDLFFNGNNDRCCGNQNRPCPPPTPPTPPTPPFPGGLCFTVFKTDAATGLALSGATYGLYQSNELITRAASDFEGRLRYNDIYPGIYTLREITPPTGYELDTVDHLVRIERNGTITIDGTSLMNYRLTDTATPIVTYTLTFTKTDATTGLALPGATFRLSNGATATSDQNGVVTFTDIPAGTYTLIETAVPARYRLSTAVNTVVVSNGGVITVDGAPVAGFVPTNDRLISTAPTVAAVTTDTTAITGTGIPGSLITVTFPDFTTLQGVVAPNGTYSIPVTGVTLTADDELRVTQTQEGYFTSTAVTTVVTAA